MLGGYYGIGFFREVTNCELVTVQCQVFASFVVG